MVLVQINATCGTGSTGKICVSVSELLNEAQIENSIFYTIGNSTSPNGVKYAKRFYTKLQTLKSRIFGNYGFNSHIATKRLIRHLKQISPDVVHLHNLHAHNLHLGMLFGYFKKSNIKLYWTFHDCWAFTAYCPHYAMAKCDKWQTECHACPQRKEYSWFFDRSKALFQKKKALFSSLDLTVITPSQWLANEVKLSFFKDYPVKVIHNGIDLDIFKPTESDFRKRYGLEGKILLLGVAFGWGKRKGLDVFVELARRLDDGYKIVLVGTNDEIDHILPETVLSIHKTENQKELAEIYSAADLFVNPTREEVLGLVNLEALACGTPVVTFDVGGSPECIDETCGKVVPCDDVEALLHAVTDICQTKPFDKKACRERAKKFDARDKFRMYAQLYTFDEA